jgi:hypothetical protein
MSENYDFENKQINNEDNQNPLDTDRRTILKKAACTIGAAYVAPVTLNMLLADKANANSGPPVGPGGGTLDPP